jgi:hypothetical protein
MWAMTTTRFLLGDGSVIPEQAGIHSEGRMDSRLRGSDKKAAPARGKADGENPRR